MSERNKMPKDWRSKLECPTCKKAAGWRTVKKGETFKCRNCGFVGKAKLIAPLKDWTFFKPEPRVDSKPEGVAPPAPTDPPSAQAPSGVTQPAVPTSEPNPPESSAKPREDMPTAVMSEAAK